MPPGPTRLPGIGWTFATTRRRRSSETDGAITPCSARRRARAPERMLFGCLASERCGRHGWLARRRRHAIKRAGVTSSCGVGWPPGQKERGAEEPLMAGAAVVDPLLYLSQANACRHSGACSAKLRARGRARCRSGQVPCRGSDAPRSFRGEVTKSSASAPASEMQARDRRYSSEQTRTTTRERDQACFCKDGPTTFGRPRKAQRREVEEFAVSHGQRSPDACQPLR